MIRASVIGANGYTGLELLGILGNHPDVEVRHIVSRSNAGTPVCAMYPSLKAFRGRLFEDVQPETIAADSDVCFLALPHAASAAMGGTLYRMGVRIIDLSADFRYKDVEVYERTYKVVHPESELLKAAVYGLPELYAEQIKSAGIIGNPGCYVTCSILSLYPLLKEKLISDKGIIIDAKSGATGAGRKADTANLFCEVDENFKAYGVTTHRHTSEIEQELSIANGAPLALSFTPHLLPVQRGILATIYCDLLPGADADAVYAAYRKHYDGKPFVLVNPEGVLPELKHVKHSNEFHVGFKIDKRLNRLIVVGCIDNLIKGASGQAVQNMNLMFGLDEAAGLEFPAKYL